MNGLYLTGWCAVGACQGVVKKSRTGKEFPSCDGFGGTCKCLCHELASAYGTRETPVATPSIAGGTILPAPTVEAGTRTPSPAVVPPPTPTTPPDFAPTLTGRRAKGELEWEVLVIVERALSVGVPATPSMISSAIAGTPSTGAVQAVLERWVRLGFVMPLTRRPVAVSAFTLEGERLGLQTMKDTAHREKRRRRGHEVRTGRRG